tara:strand:- start:88 stop:288 length:201 start_codon:yes stop_codon:yes gene_type:complete
MNIDADIKVIFKYPKFFKKKERGFVPFLIILSDPAKIEIEFIGNSEGVNYFHKPLFSSLYAHPSFC